MWSLISVFWFISRHESCSCCLLARERPRMWFLTARENSWVIYVEKPQALLFFLYSTTLYTYIPKGTDLLSGFYHKGMHGVFCLFVFMGTKSESHTHSVRSVSLFHFLSFAHVRYLFLTLAPSWIPWHFCNRSTFPSPPTLCPKPRWFPSAFIMS